MSQREFEKETEEYQSEPFYCWECVSLVAQDRTFDFTISTETPKDQYANLLIFINAMQMQSNQAKKEDIQRNPPPLSAYRLMAIKMKISYQALLTGMTIHELFYRAIENTLAKFYPDEINFECEISNLLTATKKKSGALQ